MKVKNQESGTTVKPGEAPSGAAAARTTAPASAQQAGGRDGAEAKDLRSAEGVASLLKSEFAADTAVATETAPDEEVQPGADTEAAGDTTLEAGTEEESATEGAETEGAEAGAEESDAAAEDGRAPETELPEVLRAEVEAWEESGGSLPPALQALFDKRIGKAVSQRETEKTAREAAEAKVAELTNEVTQLRAGGATVAEPLPALDVKQLDQQQRTYERFLEDAENYLDETATDDERARMERYMQSNRLDAAALKRQVREVNRELQKLPAQRQQVAAFKQAEAAAEPEAKKFFPWLDDKASPEYQQAQKVFESIPDLKQRTPLHKIVLGVYVLGLKQYEALRGGNKTNGANRTNGAAAKPTTTKAPLKVPAAGAAAPSAARTGGNAAREEAARAQFNKRPTAEGVANLFKIGLRG